VFFPYGLTSDRDAIADREDLVAKMSPDAQLEELLKILIERFGASRTIGEIYALTYAMHLAREGKTLSLSEVAEHTGIPKQNLSRWLKSQVEKERAEIELAEDDARRYNIKVTRLESGSRHLAAIAKLLNCPMDTPRSDKTG
jgi:DNA-binding MarR family transcriptional regulator